MGSAQEQQESVDPIEVIRELKAQIAEMSQQLAVQNVLIARKNRELAQYKGLVADRVAELEQA